MAHDPVHPRMPRRSLELGLCSCDLQRSIRRHDGRLCALSGCEASGLATTIIRALPEESVDSPAPLRMLARGFLAIFLSGGIRSIFLLSS